MDFVFTAKADRPHTHSRFKECPEGGESVIGLFCAITPMSLMIVVMPASGQTGG